MNSVTPFFFLLGLHSIYSKVVLNIRGPIPVVFTPMNHDQTVNFDVIPRYAHFLHGHGIKHIIVGGLPSELMNLRLRDEKAVAKKWVDACNLLGIGVIVQVGARPYVEVIEMAEYSASLGVEAMLTLPDLVFKPTTVDGLLSNFKFIGLMPEFVVAATRNISNFGGIRFRYSNLAEAYKTLNKLKEGKELIYGGSSVLVAATALGMKSTSGTLYNIYPKLIQKVISSYNTGDLKTAMDINDQLAEAVRIITSKAPSVPAMKATMEMVTGLKMGPPVLPQQRISNETLQYIQQELISIGLLECKDNY